MLRLTPYADEIERRPRDGRRILAHFDADTITVYQAYRPAIATYAAEHGFFGGPDFGFSRMSWIKPSFLWMMFRCGWATKPDQERVLAIALHRAYFDDVLARAVASSWDRVLHESRKDWQYALKRSDVRLQWDPDHGPSGQPLERRAIQLGLRGAVLAGFGGEAIAHVEDITPLVVEQREQRGDERRLLVPVEDPYPVEDPGTRARLRLSE